MNSGSMKTLMPTAVSVEHQCQRRHFRAQQSQPGRCAHQPQNTYPVRRPCTICGRNPCSSNIVIGFSNALPSDLFRDSARRVASKAAGDGMRWSIDKSPVSRTLGSAMLETTAGRPAEFRGLYNFCITISVDDGPSARIVDVTAGRCARNEVG